MTDFKKKSEELANNPEVTAALEVLAKYGAGILLLHAHDNDGNFTEMPPSIIAYEEDLKVQFRDRSEPVEGEYITVGWRWDKETQRPVPVMRCQVHVYCEDRY